MLLNELTPEEKKAFWNIANVLASVDGNAPEEESILKQYSDEMGTGFDLIDPAGIDITAELNSVSTGSFKSRKIMYFELFGVAYADTQFDEREKKILDDACAVLEIPDDVRKVLEDSVICIYDTYRKLADVFNA
ncbi:MAG: hypothetical protein IKX80_04440 [Lachnospiraceae bacterium]|nr:hypothetical protein [Lachnospiraceae bacterium]